MMEQLNCEESSKSSQTKLIQQLLDPSLTPTCRIYLFISVLQINFQCDRSTSTKTGWSDSS